MKSIYIMKKIIENKDISDDAFMVWCALRSMMALDTYEYCVSHKLVHYYLYGDHDIERRALQNIKNGFKELIEKGYVKIKRKFDNDNFIVDLTELYFEQGSGYFVTITDTEIQNVMNMQFQGISNKQLLRYFVCQVGTFNWSNNLEEQYRGKIGSMSLDALSEMVGVSKNTIIQYNKILHGNKILFCHQQCKCKVENGMIKEYPNTYSRWCDKDLALHYDFQKKDYKFYEAEKIKKRNETNRKRSIAGKYNQLVKGREYDRQTIEEIYMWAVQWNEEQMAYYNTEKSKGYNPKYPTLKDVDFISEKLVLAS